MFKPTQADRDRLRKISRAYYLFVVKGYTQKETAKLCVVSERTLCTWAKRYEWKDKKEKKHIRSGGVAVLMDGFMAYAGKRAPGIVADLKMLWDGYVNEIRRETSDT